MENILVTRRYLITGAQRVSNYWWASVISLGGISFLLTGFASFLQTNLFVFNQSKSITFFPQGLIMCFYGSLGLLFGVYLWCTIFWRVGDGFNEFNKNEVVSDSAKLSNAGVVRIFRWGLPGKNRRIDFTYKMQDVEGVRVELKEGVNPKRVISLKVKGKGNIPLTRIGQPISLENIESEASELAQFLKVSLETSYLG
jgi:ribosomal protein S28E/S33